jgi:hypothetical protein
MSQLTHVASINKTCVLMSSFPGVVGKLKWDYSYVAFMDALLQLQILQLDSRSLYVPTALQRLVIHPHRHREQLLTLDENKGTLYVLRYWC